MRWDPEFEVGRRFNRWQIVRREGNNKKNERTYLCLCDCGANKVVPSSALRSGRSGSCGCLNRDNKRAQRTTHGLSDSDTYGSWHAMRQRCNNPNNPHYQNYGGRGITVCPEWARFEGFLLDMGVKPEGLTLERKDNSLGYSKDNCRWATRVEQQNNTRSSIRFVRNGVPMTVAQLAEIAGVKRHTMYCRLVTYKWPVEKACP